ncbi:uncharacterized protein LOC117117306 [Anneissia japonica]|uniref:uncharacterized protein LOC117117306 n=1 Tax=Anneissia japonica TaxID=1529436 RepID=UPI0014255E82|nr:uncharacterized protein LOC117117306 [Anneissia japonica]
MRFGQPVKTFKTIAHRFFNMRVTYVLVIILTFTICSECMMCFCGKTLKEKRKLCEGSPTSSSQCPFGTNLVPDACGCCQECSKVEGERCGGMMSAMGKCSNGLICSCQELSKIGVCRTPARCDVLIKKGPRGRIDAEFDSSHEKCYYKLRAPSDHVIRLTIRSASGLGYAQMGGTCATKLRVVDFSEKSGRTITDICSNQKDGFPIKFTSSSRKLDIIFVQDERGCGYNGPFDMDVNYQATYAFVAKENVEENGSGHEDLLMIPP